MSILHKMISLDEITNITDEWIYKLCPTGFVPILVEKHQQEKSNGKFHLCQETLYVPEYYNHKDIRVVCLDYWEKTDPLSSYNKKSKAYYHRGRASYTTYNFHINPEGKFLMWGRFWNDEQDKVAKKYREALTDEKIEWSIPLGGVSYELWNTPLDEDLQYFAYYELQKKFEESEVA